MRNHERGSRQVAVIMGSKAMIDSFSHVLGSQLEDSGMGVARVVDAFARELRVVMMTPSELSELSSTHALDVAA